MKVFEIQYHIDIENKEAEQAKKLEKALFVRTEPIGQDRYFRQYWCFEGDDRLFIQSERGETDAIMHAVDNGSDVSAVLAEYYGRTASPINKVTSFSDLAGSPSKSPHKKNKKTQRFAAASPTSTVTEVT